MSAEYTRARGIGFLLINLTFKFYILCVCVCAVHVMRRIFVQHVMITTQHIM